MVVACTGFSVRWRLPLHKQFQEFWQVQEELQDAACPKLTGYSDQSRGPDFFASLMTQELTR
jgi:hypothetical protein